MMCLAQEPGRTFSMGVGGRGFEYLGLSGVFPRQSILKFSKTKWVHWCLTLLHMPWTVDYLTNWHQYVRTQDYVSDKVVRREMLWHRSCLCYVSAGFFCTQSAICRSWWLCNCWSHQKWGSHRVLETNTALCGLTTSQVTLSDQLGH